MQQTYVYAKENNSARGPLVMVGLVLSFVFVSIFGAFEMGNGLSIVGARESAQSAYFTYVVYSAVIGWILFELFMRLYYFFVSLSMYVFVVPKKAAYETLRISFILRNVLVGAISLLLFASPIWYNYLQFFTILIEFGTLAFAFVLIKKKYLKELLAPYAWKAFMRPFLIYEVLSLLVMIGGVV